VRCLQIRIGMAFLAGWLLIAAGCAPSHSWNPSDPIMIPTGGTGGTSTASTDKGGEGGLFATGGGGASAAPACFGRCTQSVSTPFERITLFSIGTPDQLRPCSDLDSSSPIEYYAEPDAKPYTCPSCGCSSPTCVLPQAMHASAAPCPGEGVPTVTFDPPAGDTWQGDCTDENAIPPDLPCDGVPCVQSLTIESPAVEPCMPIEEGEVTKPAVSWGLMARECLIHVDEAGPGCETNESCVTRPPPGFRLCLFRSGDIPEIPCPEPYDDDRYVVYVAWTDTRGCSPCECGDPEGAECEAAISVFKDETCGTPFGSFPVSNATTETCFGLPPGSGLGSKDGSFLINEPGACAPTGGEPIGEVTPIVPMTLCCDAPEPDPAP
jgi:hypothetical protein